MRVREYTVLFSLALIWGASFFFIKIGVREVSPATVVAGRLACSLLTLGAVIAFKPELIAGWRSYWRLAVVTAVVNFVLPYLLISWGETRIESGTASILNATTPLFTVLLANWWVGVGYEALTTRRAVGVVVGFVGVAILIGPLAFNFAGHGAAGILGDLAVLVAAIAYGFGALFSKGFAGSAPLVGPFLPQVVSLSLVLPIALLWSPPTHLPSAAAIGAIATLGAVGTGVAYLLYFWLIEHVGATRTTLVTYLLPCTALVWGVLLLGEHVAWNAVVGLVFVLLGTMVTNGTLDTWASRLLRRARPAVVNVDTGMKK